MPVHLSKAITTPVLQGVHQIGHYAHSFIVQTKHNLYNLFSKHVLEPLEARSKLARDARRSENCVKEYKKLIPKGRPEEFPVIYCNPTSKSPECIVDELFQNDNAFSVLKELQPGIERAEEKESFKRGFTQYCQRGVCYGESLVILKISRYFPFSGPLRKDILFDSYAPVVAFLQIIGFLKDKWGTIQAVKEAVARDGFSPDRLFLDEGRIKESELFYYLSGAFPKTSKSNLRMLMQCILAEDFFFSSQQLEEKMQRLSQIERDFMNSSRKHSNLPIIPKGTWLHRHKLAIYDKKEKGFIDKAVAVAMKYFQSRSGSFVLSAWSEFDAHAVFMKKEKEALLYYDPLVKVWLLFSKASKALEPILRSIVALADPQESLEISVDSLS